MSSAGHTEKSMRFCAQGAQGVVEEIENFRVTERCCCSRMYYRVYGNREAGTKPVWGIREGHFSRELMSELGLD